LRIQWTASRFAAGAGCAKPLESTFQNQRGVMRSAAYFRSGSDTKADCIAISHSTSSLGIWCRSPSLRRHGMYEPINSRLLALALHDTLTDDDQVAERSRWGKVENRNLQLKIY
jgi:hypothetical protein